MIKKCLQFATACINNWKNGKDSKSKYSKQSPTQKQ